MEFLSTVIAIAITFAFCFFIVRGEVKYEEAQERKEEEKARRLKFWLDECAQSRKNDQDLKS